MGLADLRARLDRLLVVYDRAWPAWSRETEARFEQKYYDLLSQYQASTDDLTTYPLLEFYSLAWRIRLWFWRPGQKNTARASESHPDAMAGHSGRVHESRC